MSITGPIKPSFEIRGSQLIRNTIWNFVGLALPLLIGVVTLPLIIRSLGTDRFGILSLAWIVIGYFGFIDLGLGRATTKFVAECLGRGTLEEVPKYFWTTVIFQAALGIIGLIVLVALTPLLVGHLLHIPLPLLHESKVTFYLLALSLPIVLVSASFRGLLEAGQRFDLINFVKIPSSALNYLFPLVGILIGFHLPGIMILLVFSRLMTLLAMMVMGYKVFPQLKAGIHFDRHAIRPLLSFGGWVTVSNVVGPLLVYVDRFLIGSILSIEAVSYYSAPYEFIMRLGIVPGSLIMTLFPTFSTLESGGDKKRARLLYGSSVKFVLLSMGVIIVPLIFFARKIISLWLGQAFVDRSTLVFQFLALGFLINALANVPFGYLQGIGRADITAKLHIIEVAFYFPLCYVFIKNWGINGAALAWLIRVSLDMALLFWASAKKGHMGYLILSESRVFLSAAAIFVYLCFTLILNDAGWGIFGFIALTAAFGLCIWLFAFGRREKKWILERAGLLLKMRIAPGDAE
jgi:O-antigen/teichoic acid export membrane protein